MAKHDNVVFSMDRQTFSAGCASFKDVMKPLPQQPGDLLALEQKQQLDECGQGGPLSLVERPQGQPQHYHQSFVSEEEEMDKDMDMDAGTSDRSEVTATAGTHSQQIFFDVIGGNLNRHKFVGQKPASFDATVQVYNVVNAGPCDAADLPDVVSLQPAGFPLAATFQSVLDELPNVSVWKLQKDLSVVPRDPHLLLGITWYLL